MALKCNKIKLALDKLELTDIFSALVNNFLHDIAERPKEINLFMKRFEIKALEEFAEEYEVKSNKEIKNKIESLRGEI